MTTNQSPRVREIVLQPSSFRRDLLPEWCDPSVIRAVMPSWCLERLFVQEDAGDDRLNAPRDARAAAGKVPEEEAENSRQHETQGLKASQEIRSTSRQLLHPLQAPMPFPALRLQRVVFLLLSTNWKVARPSLRVLLTPSCESQTESAKAWISHQVSTTLEKLEKRAGRPEPSLCMTQAAAFKRGRPASGGFHALATADPVSLSLPPPSHSHLAPSLSCTFARLHRQVVFRALMAQHCLLGAGRIRNE